MRRLLLTCVGLAGIAGAAGCAQAAPGPVYLGSEAAAEASQLPALTDGAQVQPVQYYDDWRYREWRRRERYERWRRHEEWRRWHNERERYGYNTYGYGRY